MRLLTSILTLVIVAAIGTLLYSGNRIASSFAAAVNANIDLPTRSTGAVYGYTGATLPPSNQIGRIADYVISLNDGALYGPKGADGTWPPNGVKMSAKLATEAPSGAVAGATGEPGTAEEAARADHRHPVTHATDIPVTPAGNLLSATV